MTNGSIGDVIASGLCHGCGLCAAAFPQHWTMETGGSLPRPISTGVVSQTETDGLQFCPGHVMTSDYESLASDLWAGEPVSRELGVVRSSYIGYAHGAQRSVSSSGGLLTEYLSFLLQHGRADAVFHVAADDVHGGFGYVTSTSSEQVRGRAKTRYFPVSLDQLEKAAAASESLVFVGPPCFVAGVRRLIRAYPARFGAIGRRATGMTTSLASPHTLPHPASRTSARRT